ncbi:MAG: peptide chain release factor N(5)-glutamine methyltransferase [Candidatus Caccosoma sp.]|nr:peptide chain release factor N(5)-glutamine methyltransferase [Candidatus Caccosoma sp.]
MKYTYNKMIKECEKRVQLSNLEVHTVKWLFFNSDLFCGYSNLNNEVTDDVKDKFNKMIDLYINEKMPPQYILNKVFFFNYPFYVDEGCFIPRPETEQLVEETIYRIDDMFNNKPIKIADVCCGSGAIGITLKKEIENCDVTLCELSSEAINIAKKNAKALNANVSILQGDFINPLLENNLKFDVLLCNPPYIKNDEILDEMVVGHEPNMALFGGVDGLDFYRRIFTKFDDLLNENGFMGFEFGYDQKEKLEELVKSSFPTLKYEFLKDYNNLYRMLFIYKN